MSHTSSRALSLAFVGCVCALALIPSFAQAAFVNLGPAGDFNVFVFNNNTQFGSDAHGKIGVGGNATFGSFTIASALGASTDNLIVGGNYSNNGASLKGGMLVGGNVNWTNPTTTGRVAVNGNATFTDGSLGTPVLVGGTYTAPGYFPPNTYSSPATFPFSFTDVADYLTDQADFMATLPFNGNTTIAFGGINMTGTDSSFNNFYISAADLAAGTGLTINAPAGSTAVVNVDGSPAFFDNMGINLNGVNEQHVLYNFYNATSLTISGIGVRGSLLAPRADVNFSGNIDGTLIAKNLTGQGESHLFLFQGELPPRVPEPATIALLGLALTGAAACHRKR
jgi:choice-of-anchor A domain-containing protein